MASLGTHFQIDPNKLVCDSRYIFKGVNYRITVLSERLIRFEYSTDGVFNDNATEIVHNRVFEKPKFKAEQDDKFLVITTKYFVMQYAKEKPYKGPSFAPDSNLKVKLVNADKMWYYGHPEARNFKGTAYSIEDFLDRTTLSNGLYSTDGFAFLDDSNTMIIDNDGFMQNGNKRIDFYLFVYRRDFGLCLKDYFTLTGYPPLIPRYSLGIWWNRDQIYSGDDVLKLIKQFKKNEIPLSVILLSEFWHKKDSNNYNLYKTGYTFNSELFPDPSLTIRDAHNKNVRIGINLDGSEGIGPFEDGYQKMCEDLNLPMDKVIPFKVLDKNFIVSYFNNLINPLYELGVDFFWLDSKEEIVTRVLNYYHFNDYNKSTGKRGLILSRNGNKAGHLYPIHYSGETKVLWETLKYLPYYNSTSSNIGISWWSHDVGGYKDGIEDSELYLRYTQLATFSPVFRFSAKRGVYYKREPWRWDMLTYTIVKKYCNLRHRLIPYLYTEAYKYHKNCLPIIQPLYYYYPELIDEPSYQNEYYFGTELLISPITKPKDYVMNRSIEKIFLPKGVWYDFVTGKKFIGNKRYISFFRDEEYPVFAKAGSIIPLAILNDDINNTNSPREMEIQVFPGNSNVYKLYEDDGVSNLYKEGYYIITSIDFDYAKDNYTLAIHPVEGKTNIIPDFRNYKIRFRNTRKPERVRIDINSEIIDNFDSYTEDNDFIVEIKNVDTRKQLVVNCMGNNIEIDAVRILNEEINGIISDLKIETFLKEKLASVMFSDLDISKKRIEVRKLSKYGLDQLFIKMFIKLLEYIQEI